MNPKVSFLMIALLFYGLLISCNNDNLEKYSLSVQKDSTANLTIVSNKIKENIDTIYVNSSKQIIGAWQDLGKESLTVEITKNMISYIEHHESYNFKIKSDSIYIYYPDLILSGRPYLIKDTLVISMTNGEGKYIRLKK